jgi:uncharacterized RDD family membrane protein YckC
MTIAWLGAIFVLAFIVGFVAGALDTSEETDDEFFDEAFGPAALILLVVVPVAYFAGLEALPSQATLGKMMLKLKVTNLAGARIGFGRSLGRSAAKFLSLLPAGLGCLPAAFTERRQAVHDMLAGTVVVNARPSTGP